MLPIKEELEAMGVKDRCSSFYYEKVAGRTAGKSVYQLKKMPTNDEDFEFDLARGKMYIKDFDFTDIPEREVNIQDQLKIFNDTDIYEQDPIKTCHL